MLVPGTTTYFRGTVTYHGRAIGNLPLGNYLLLVKNDLSVSIHGGSKISPRNYLGVSCTLTSGKIADGSHCILSKNKETIDVAIETVHWQRVLQDWSEDNVEITNSEAHLVQKLISEIDQHISDVVVVDQEVQSGVGPIDVLVTSKDGTRHVIEAKRRKASTADCSQLHRYCTQFDNVKGYIASPSIGKKALAYLESLGYSWIEVSFQELNKAV